MRNWKFSVGLALLIVVVVFSIQNAESLQVNFLFWHFTMRRALLLFLVLVAGMLLGWGLHARAARRSDVDDASRKNEVTKDR